MKTMMTRLAVAAMIGVSSLSAFAGAASANEIRLGLSSGSVVDVQYRDERDWRRDRQDRRHDRRDWGRERRGHCAPWLAADKAGAYGLRRARVVAVTPRRVVVEGRFRGGFRTIAFANMRGCPRLGR
ncbi:hypothetical protein ASG39_02060 [Rhizobium sp. Leaf371]|uniref:hypothetical protein n=1 Tax=unclassified Rhizobium TaxID=2613769 RepID=UPI0007135493|nr:MULTISPECIES: hypothetical protein [unclassified Rhizobium]KQS72567.1 hypothetical protein ASG39_02060 [Rhizobium sp. Leaf371]TCM58531.1 hypothetical protein C8J36_101434 [Rhizobium sp. PP-F2F-G48]